MSTGAPANSQGAGDHDTPPVDVGAIAQSLRPKASTAAVVLWWTIFTFLVFACIFPRPILIAIVWFYVVVLVWKRRERRARFHRNLAGFPCLSRATRVTPPKEWPHVTVLVPARDEEKNIDAAARSLLASSYPDLDVWFIDDHSTDQTPRILDTIQRDFPQVHVIHDPPVVEAWFGKSNALWQGVLQIEREQGQHRDRDDRYFLFVDADVMFEPEMLREAVALAERDRLDYLTVMPHLITKTLAEQFVLPTGWKGIAEGADHEHLNDPKSFPIGIGAFMLVRESTYYAFGGHKGLGQWHPEDTLMAAAVKHIGGRVGFAWTPDLMRVRFYENYRQVKNNTIRKMRIFFGDQLALPLSMMALRLSTTVMALPMIAAGVVPQLLSGNFNWTLMLLAIAGLVLYVDEAGEYKDVNKVAAFHPAIPWLHPISGLLRVWFAITFAGQIIANKPMEWRGRREFGAT
ncbi:MAG: glycosyltransferase [Candidatus Hydrogenedentes bacterium]|nr:glycosyltransferase [Candidatus Hydrogenedentota bacterium]